MNPIDQCIQKISSGNRFSYVRDRTYGTYVRTDKGDAICPPPITNGGGIINKNFRQKIVNNFLPIILAYVLCAQRNRLIETVLLSTHNKMFWFRNKKIIFLLHTLN